MSYYMFIYQECGIFLVISYSLVFNAKYIHTHTNTFTNLVNQVPKRTLICLNYYCWAVLATKLAFISSFFFFFANVCVTVCVSGR